jgi:hypothetical protein
MTNRVGMSRTLCRLLACEKEIVDGLRPIAALAVVLRKLCVVLIEPTAVQCLDCSRSTLVKQAPTF